MECSFVLHHARFIEASSQQLSTIQVIFPIFNLLTELQLYIFATLDFQSLGRVSITCKTFNNILSEPVSSNHIWSSIAKDQGLTFYSSENIRERVKRYANIRLQFHLLTAENSMNDQSVVFPQPSIVNNLEKNFSTNWPSINPKKVFHRIIRMKILKSSIEYESSEEK